jgi:asparagine synthase (glutamine-hydrolysing)
MAGIAGISRPGRQKDVRKMLRKIRHRGQETKTIVDQGATLGVVYNDEFHDISLSLEHEHLICDEVGEGHFACVKTNPRGIILSRDTLGVVPLYYGLDNSGALCFASEVKALLSVTNDIHELIPGTRLVEQRVEHITNVSLELPKPASADQISSELRRVLTQAIENRVNQNENFGSLLSGGLDSSAISALARPYINEMHTFASGLEDAPDLFHARNVAEHLKTQHHERIVTFEEMVSVLPDVIYHLESFDALLVRSSIMHYLAAQVAVDYCPAIFSGEGGDELFAGYSYLKNLPISSLPNELIDITRRLHNTALQRVDRCTMAHGVVAWVPFLDPGVVECALSIPVGFKLHDGTEKWILREAIRDLLPEQVVDRPKAKFWEGSGVADLLSQFAEKTISDYDFKRERLLYNGWRLNSKEELVYYRLFRDRFGELEDLGWMGRTKGAPVN